ncbi:putative paraquat-inducible protein A [Magnetofaba australis IT-1]|uniref:Putative paraquat-inducible protein A n=2 Tax=Magnetofaba TaxID=1472292 RepID=A0A1Y2K3T7_9PROT|nr:putative paraquat-inducible protein A [Magnetofaba australis IT-1]
MTVIQMGRGEPDTIMSGVIKLYAHGMWPLALIVFVASILVPLFKLAALSWILYATQRGSAQRLRTRAQMYRVTEFIGRWSMVDIFVIAILTALVELGAIALIEPGPAAIFFGAVVVFTMLAAESFDPRLMWDVASQSESKHD